MREKLLLPKVSIYRMPNAINISPPLYPKTMEGIIFFK